MVIFERYIIAAADGEGIHGEFQRVVRLWKNDDGTAMFRIEADSSQWEKLNKMEGVVVLPSLNAPAERHGSRVKDHFAALGIAVDTGDTTLNMLRKLRDKKGSVALIDQPF